MKIAFLNKQMPFINHTRLTVAMVSLDAAQGDSMRRKIATEMVKVICISSLEQLLYCAGREVVDIVIIDSNISADLNKTIVLTLKKMNRQVKILIVSDNCSPQFEIDMRTSGVTYFGLKPVDALVLENIVGKIIGKDDGLSLYNKSINGG
jgi:DNA-binding response OmpR family regulator